MKTEELLTERQGRLVELKGLIQGVENTIIICQEALNNFFISSDNREFYKKELREASQDKAMLTEEYRILMKLEYPKEEAEQIQRMGFYTSNHVPSMNTYDHRDHI